MLIRLARYIKKKIIEKNARSTWKRHGVDIQPPFSISSIRNLLITPPLTHWTKFMVAIKR